MATKQITLGEAVKRPKKRKAASSPRKFKTKRKTPRKPPV